MKISEKQKTAIVDKFVRSLSDALTNNSDFNEIREVKAAMYFYSKTKESEVEPAGILNTINRLLTSNLADGFIKEFSNTLEERLQGLAISYGENGPGFSYSLDGVPVSFDVELVVNETNTVLSTVTIGASQNIGLAVEGIHKSDTGSYKIDKIQVSVNLYLFTKMVLGTKTKNVASCKFDISNLEI